MMNRNLLYPMLGRANFGLCFALADDAGGTPPATPPAGDTPPATPPAGDTPPATPPAGDTPPATPWWKDAAYSAEEQQWLTAKGLTEDDAMKILPKLVKGHRSAEQRIGKGLDNIMDRPGKDQDHAEWARANAASLGLPDQEDGYSVDPPEFWPKDLAWDKTLDAAARKVAFEKGVHPSAHKAYVDLFAQKMKTLETDATEKFEQANTIMMADLQTEWGAQTDARLAMARQGAQAVAERAGLDGEALERITGVLSKSGGDAQAIRFMAAIGSMMGEDSGVGLGNGGGLGTTPAEARAELARFEGPDGDYGKAFASGNTGAMKELRAKREQLSKLASGA
jgi:hypothetical protein